MSAALVKAKEKAEMAQARARAIAGKLFHGGKGSAMAAGLGFAGFHAVKALRNVDQLKGDYRVPGVLFLIGHFGKRKHHDVGTGALVLSGFLLAGELDAKKATQTVATTTPAGTATAQVPAAQGLYDLPAAGMYDAGMIYGGEAGAIVDSDADGFDDDEG